MKTAKSKSLHDDKFVNTKATNLDFSQIIKSLLYRDAAKNKPNIIYCICLPDRGPKAGTRTAAAAEELYCIAVGRCWWARVLTLLARNELRSVVARQRFGIL